MTWRSRWRMDKHYRFGDAVVKVLGPGSWDGWYMVEVVKGGAIWNRYWDKGHVANVPADKLREVEDALRK